MEITEENIIEEGFTKVGNHWEKDNIQIWRNPGIFYHVDNRAFTELETIEDLRKHIDRL